MSEIKSAYELAMERMGGENLSLTDEQKAAIAEVDSGMKAQIAEAEILTEQQLAAETDPAKASLIRQALAEKIEKIKTNAEAEKKRIREKQSS